MSKKRGIASVPYRYSCCVSSLQKLILDRLISFSRKIPSFATIEDRADRLMNKTAQLLEYAEQVKDAYQSRLDARQNRSMQFLTIISTIFLPLTLITSWYGMNFQNMPELQNGYPGVIFLSVLVIILCIWIFKIKKLL